MGINKPGLAVGTDLLNLHYPQLPGTYLGHPEDFHRNSKDLLSQF
jgi:hypothetical protein